MTYSTHLYQDLYLFMHVHNFGNLPWQEKLNNYPRKYIFIVAGYCSCHESQQKMLGIFPRPIEELLFDSESQN